MVVVVSVQRTSGIPTAHLSRHLLVVTLDQVLIRMCGCFGRQWGVGLGGPRFGSRVAHKHADALVVGEIFEMKVGDLRLVSTKLQVLCMYGPTACRIHLGKVRLSGESEVMDMVFIKCVPTIACIDEFVNFVVCVDSAPIWLPSDAVSSFEVELERQVPCQQRIYEDP
jgi:hypothetical protein